MGGESRRTRGTTVDLSAGLMDTNASDQNKGGIPRTQKSVQQDRTGGSRGIFLMVSRAISPRTRTREGCRGR